MKIVFITGAGISTASGLPTYRGANGLYGNEPIEDGYRIDEILSRKIANIRPDLFNKYHGQIEKAIALVEPNTMHYAIAALQEQHDVRIYTQNIDDLHERAGSKHVVHLHGGGAEKEPVILFGDYLDPQKLKWMKAACKAADILVLVGSSAAFHYIQRPFKKAKYDHPQVFILDPDPQHPLADTGVHKKNPSEYADIIKIIPELF